MMRAPMILAALAILAGCDIPSEQEMKASAECWRDDAGIQHCAKGIPVPRIDPDESRQASIRYAVGYLVATYDPRTEVTCYQAPGGSLSCVRR